MAEVDKTEVIVDLVEEFFNHNGVMTVQDWSDILLEAEKVIEERGKEA